MTAKLLTADELAEIRQYIADALPVGRLTRLLTHMLTRLLTYIEAQRVEIDAQRDVFRRLAENIPEEAPDSLDVCIEGWPLSGEWNVIATASVGELRRAAGLKKGGEP